MRTTLYIGFSMLVLLFTSCQEKEKKGLPKEKRNTVVPMTSPTGANSSLPYLFSNGEKTLMSWVEKDGDSLTKLKYAELVAGTWQEPLEILQGTDWFVNWADFPMIAENQGNLWSHVLKKSTSGTYSYDVKMNVLPKGAAHWKTDMTLHSDGTPTEHGFVTILPYKSAFFVTWLDGRNTQENEAGERGAMTIRAAEVSTEGTIHTESELDRSTCDCCQTTAAITDNGPIVLYRDRSEEEVRDISIVRQIDGKWTSPKSIHNDEWKIKGCPVNGPKAAVLDNNLAVAWFTGAQENPRVQLSLSRDGGARFENPIQIGGANSIGRVDVLLVDTDTAIVSWMEAKDKQAQLKALKVRSGIKSKELLIANLDASRKTGFPQMELVGDEVYFAWTTISGSNSQIQMAKVSAIDF